MAMCNHPALLIADEPTTALDVTVQKEIVDLMKELQQEYGTAILFITHDLALAKTITDDFIVLDQGVIVDRPPVRQTLGKLNKNLDIDRERQPLLKVEELQVDYPDQFNWLGKPKAYFKAVQEVNFELYQGETLGLVGESGCGKSTLSKCILGLQPVTAGKILFKGKTISQYGESEFRKLRRAIQIIFQDPYSSLNQRMNIRDTLAEPMIVHGLVSKKNVDKQVDVLLEQVQLPLSSRSKYPHEFSGGQRQRIAIARALAVKPELIICDESVAALDIKIQEQILELLMNLQQQQHLTYLFITHDIKVVARICNRILVMEQGRIVEQGPTDNILQHPQVPYTQKLLAAVP
jgi:peptide/nickel transport system ATP-binding protein